MKENVVLKREMSMKNKLKLSKYNVDTIDHSGDLLLFNTLTGNKIKIDKEDVASVKTILKDPECRKDSKFTQVLVTNEFIIDDEVNEDKLARNLHRSTINSEKTLTLILLPTENCNFRCTYCYETFEKNLMTENVQNAVIQYVEKNITNYDSIHFEWFGGEPLIAYRVIEYISRNVMKICRANRVRYTASMTTNGYLLSIDMFRKLQKLRVVHFQVTIDGTSAIHDTQRVLMGGQATFNRIMKNLKEIKESIPSRTFSINVRTNISANMLESLDDFSDLLIESFADDKRFKFFWKPVGDWGGDSVKKVKLCTMSEILPYIERNMKKGMDFSPVIDMIKPAGSVCYASKKNNFVIGSDGILYKCTVAFNMKENQVGQLNDDGKMYLNKERYNLWVSGHEENDVSCQDCQLRPACQGATCPLSRIRTGSSPCPSQKYYLSKHAEFQFQ